MKKFTLAVIQEQTSAYSKPVLEHTLERIREAAQAGADLVLLQELHTSHYFCQTEDAEIFDLAESIPGPSTDKLARLAKELKIVIVGSLFEKRAAGIYHNTAVVFDTDGSLAGKYRKMHIPDDPGYSEKFYFTPGDLGFNPIQTSLGKLGVLICWDQWFPEAARLMCLAGADILLYPTSIGWDRNDSPEEQQHQLAAWLNIQRSHAIANGVPLAACNRVGFEATPKNPEQGINFWGHSFIVGPQGEYLSQASGDKAKIIYAEIDLQRSEQVRRIWPFFRDRRIDRYAELLKRFKF